MSFLQNCECNSRCTLTTTTGTNERNVRAGLDNQVQIAQNADTRTSGITEVDLLEANAALDVLRNAALGRLGIDFRTGVEQRNDVSCGTLGGRHVGDEGEDVASLDRTEHRALRSWEFEHQYKD